MYRIELAPGEEAIFKSMDEMVTGIRGGLIKDHARIWHKSTEKWLPIEFHPHYKIAREKVATGTAPAPAVAPLRLDPRHAPAPVAHAEPAVEPAPAPMPPLPAMPEPEAAPAYAATTAEPSGLLALADEPAMPTPAPLPADEAEFISLDSLDASPGAAPVDELAALELDPLPAGGRRRVRTLGLIGGLAIVAVAGGAWALHRSPAQPTPATARPKETTTSFAGSPAVAAAAAPAPAPMSSLPASTLADEPSPEPSHADAASHHAAGDSIVPAVLPRPAVSAGPITVAMPTESAAAGAMTPAAFGGRYAAAYEKARDDFEKGLSVFGFGNIFVASRLAAGDGVPATRSAISAADNLLRTFRKQTDGIERAYHDSLEVISHRNNWSLEQLHAWEAASQVEGAEVQLVGSSLLKATGAMYDLLAAQAGEYKVNGSSISFDDPQAARDYGALRQQIQQLLVSKSAAGNTSAGRLAKAIGSARPPVES